jgi:hypothetical protein
MPAEQFTLREIQMRKRIVMAAFAAGLSCGISIHYVWPRPVLADSAAVEIRARKFVLVNQHGAVIGTLAEEATGPALKLFDENGREIWAAGNASPGKAPNRSFALSGR